MSKVSLPILTASGFVDATTTALFAATLLAVPASFMLRSHLQAQPVPNRDIRPARHARVSLRLDMNGGAADKGLHGNWSCAADPVEGKLAQWTCSSCGTQGFTSTGLPPAGCGCA